MVMITIMIVSLATMLIVATLINHYATTEGRAIEQLLADSRFYWAMEGTANLLLSQVVSPDGLRNDGACNDDAEREVNLRNLAKVANITWDYDLANWGATLVNTNNDPARQFQTSLTGADIADTDPDTEDGRMSLTVSIPAAGRFFWQDVLGLGGANVFAVNHFQVLIQRTSSQASTALPVSPVHDDSINLFGAGHHRFMERDKTFVLDLLEMVEFLSGLHAPEKFFWNEGQIDKKGSEPGRLESHARCLRFRGEGHGIQAPIRT